MSKKENRQLTSLNILPVVNGFMMSYNYRNADGYNCDEEIFVYNTWKEVVNHLSNNTMDVKNER